MTDAPRPHGALDRLDRRTWLKGVALAGAGVALGRPAFAAIPQDSRPAPKEKLKILLLGGTAFLGPKIVEHAAKRGHVVTLFNRGKTRPELFPDFEKLRGDRDTNDYASLKDRSFDVVIDTSAYVPREVRQAAAALGDRVKHYVFVSSVSVYPNADTDDTNEDSPVDTVPDPATEEVMKHYGGLKALCEAAAEAAYPKKTTNVRPGLIVGDGDGSDRFTYWPARIADGGEVLAPMGPDQTIQWIDVRDLAAWIVRVSEERTMGVYNALGPPVRLGDLFDACKAVSKSDAKIVYVSRDFLEAEKVAPWQDLPAWFPPPAGKDRCAVCSNARAVAKGLTFSPVADVVADTLRFHKTRPPTRKFRAGMTREREAEVLAKWKARAAK